MEKFILIAIINIAIIGMGFYFLYVRPKAHWNKESRVNKLQETKVLALSQGGPQIDLNGSTAKYEKEGDSESPGMLVKRWSVRDEYGSRTTHFLIAVDRKVLFVAAMDELRQMNEQKARLQAERVQSLDRIVQVLASEDSRPVRERLREFEESGILVWNRVLVLSRDGIGKIAAHELPLNEITSIVHVNTAFKNECQFERSKGNLRVPKLGQTEIQELAKAAGLTVLGGRPMPIGRRFVSPILLILGSLLLIWMGLHPNMPFKDLFQFSPILWFHTFGWRYLILVPIIILSPLFFVGSIFFLIARIRRPPKLSVWRRPDARLS